MSDKNFGVKQISIIGGSGTPTLSSPSVLNLNSPTVAISTNLSVGGDISVSGVSTLGIVTGATYYGDTSNAVDGRWILTGDGSNYTLTGIGITSGNNTDPVLYLARGRVYEFVNNAGGSHPFEIRESNGGSAYTAGISGSSTGTTRFEVPMNAPNTLFYQCTIHAGMGNTISVYPNLI